MIIKPMLLEEIDQPFDDDNYMAELKYDGIRLLYSTREIPFLQTRHGLVVTNRFPEIVSNQIPSGTVLDGEVIQADSQGHPDFESLLSRFQRTNSEKIKHYAEVKPVTYCVFDILYYNNTKITHWPLDERKALLNDLLSKPSPTLLNVSSFGGTQGKALFKACQERNLEGIVLKRKHSIYEIGKRSASWLKVINYTYCDVWITGYRKDKFGLTLTFDNGKPAGFLELGIPSLVLKRLIPLMKELKSFETNKHLTIPQGILRCKVKARDLTKAGYLRLPVYSQLII